LTEFDLELKEYNSETEEYYIGMVKYKKTYGFGNLAGQ